jgi:hypothetical protein
MDAIKYFIAILTVVSLQAQEIGQLIACDFKKLDPAKWVSLASLDKAGNDWAHVLKVADRLEIPLAVKRSDGSITIAKFIRFGDLFDPVLLVGKDASGNMLSKTVGREAMTEDSPVLFVGLTRENTAKFNAGMKKYQEELDAELEARRSAKSGAK